MTSCQGCVLGRAVGNWGAILLPQKIIAVIGTFFFRSNETIYLLAPAVFRPSDCLVWSKIHNGVKKIMHLHYSFIVLRRIQSSMSLSKCQFRLYAGEHIRIQKTFDPTQRGEKDYSVTLQFHSCT